MPIQEEGPAVAGIASEAVFGSHPLRDSRIDEVLAGPFSKLGVHSRAEAVAAAYRRGLVGDDVVAHAFDTALIGAD